MNSIRFRVGDKVKTLKRQVYHSPHGHQVHIPEGVTYTVSTLLIDGRIRLEGLTGNWYIKYFEGVTSCQ